MSNESFELEEARTAGTVAPVKEEVGFDPVKATELLEENTALHSDKKQLLIHVSELEKQLVREKAAARDSEEDLDRYRKRIERLKEMLDKLRERLLEFEDDIHKKKSSLKTQIKKLHEQNR